MSNNDRNKLFGNNQPNLLSFHHQIKMKDLREIPVKLLSADHSNISI